MYLIKSNGYNVEIGTKIFKSISSLITKNKYSSHFIICDENTFQFCLPSLIHKCPNLRDAHIIELESGEASKAINISTYVWETLIENKADKNAVIINLGGGVVSDLGGFCASTYKRGIDFINIPTTLLAMADASIGGKTGINLSVLKNALGTFSQPKGVFINPDYLNTLPEQHYKNGLAEIFKIALICDKNFWNELKNTVTKSSKELLLLKSVTLKNKIVLKDPFDNGNRKILNFGHTIGHAIESILLGTNNELLHGEAILIGMMVESHLSFQKKLLSKKELQEVFSLLKKVFEPQKINELNLTSIIELMKNDKKSQGNKFQFALIDKIGSCKFDVIISDSQIKKAIDFYNSTF